MVLTNQLSAKSNLILYSVHYSRSQHILPPLVLSSYIQMLKKERACLSWPKKTGSFMYETIDLLNYNGKNASHNVIH